MRVFTQRDGKIKAIVYRMTQLNRKLQGASLASFILMRFATACRQRAFAASINQSAGAASFSSSKA